MKTEKLNYEILEDLNTRPRTTYLESNQSAPPKFTPMALVRLPEPFDHPAWLFESLSTTDIDRWRTWRTEAFASFPKRNSLKSFGDLCATMVRRIETER